ncbi:TetR/AcrR family transcriptional regulator [Bradyrhizobium genosp. A]|uniref:TetR/AcrR family transcriptional regulator n=1 Tax=Bradyrhizobium genosp. A TaxID=83626 RepID=UPI003CF5783E
MTEQITQRPSPKGSVMVHELNHRVDNEVAAAIGVAFLAATRSGNDKLSAMDRRAGFDAKDGEHFNTHFNVSSEGVRQQKAAKAPPRKRILSAAAELFLRYGIARVSVVAIAKAAATAKATLYRHFASKDELVAEYLRESAKRLDACWVKIGPPGSASAPFQLGTRLAEMADGIVSGWACRLTNAAAELKEKSHPAQRVIRAYKALQRIRLTRLCRAAGLRNPSMLADALLLLFDGACIMAPSVGRIGLSSRFLLLSKAMIAAHAKARSARSQMHQP